MLMQAQRFSECKLFFYNASDLINSRLWRE